MFFTYKNHFPSENYWPNYFLPIFIMPVIPKMWWVNDAFPSFFLYTSAIICLPSGLHWRNWLIQTTSHHWSCHMLSEPLLLQAENTHWSSFTHYQSEYMNQNPLTINQVKFCSFQISTTPNNASYYLSFACRSSIFSDDDTLAVQSILMDRRWAHGLPKSVFHTLLMLLLLLTFLPCTINKSDVYRTNQIIRFGMFTIASMDIRWSHHVIIKCLSRHQHCCWCSWFPSIPSSGSFSGIAT